jgi:hypothetical protein
MIETYDQLEDAGRRNIMRLVIGFLLLWLVAVFLIAGCGAGSSPAVQPSPPAPSSGSGSPSPQANPVITSISPSSVEAGGATFQLTVNGLHLQDKDHIEGPFTVFFGAAALKTTVVSDTVLIASVPAEYLLNPNVVPVGVGSADYASNTVNFEILPPATSKPALMPTADTLGPNASRQFTVAGFGDQSTFTWSVQEGDAGGKITAGGLYTAPSHGGIYHVVATSALDPSQAAVATISVLNSGFTQTGNMHLARSGHRATLLTDGRVLVVGSDGAAELFDPVSGTFSVTGSMTTARYGASFTLLANGRVLVVGGYGPGTSELPRLASAEVYDPQTGSFTVTGSMSIGRILHTATLLKDGRVLVAGGTDRRGGGGGATGSAEVYDPSAGTFSTTGSMNTDRAEHSATLLTSGEVLIAGGWNGHAADSADDPPWDPLFTELFDPSSGTFKYAASMSTTRIGHTATRLSDGKVLLLGGIPTLQNVHSQPIGVRYAEIFDPTTQTITGLGDLMISRDGYTVTLLQSGEILLVGGKIQDVPVPTAELLNPATGVVSATGGLGTPRVGHSATTLQDGRVLVTGGTDANGKALASAELYK